jgi:hypothetical protein
MQTKIQKKVSQRLLEIHKNRSKKSLYEPQEIHRTDVETSPVFQNPQKWVSRLRMIDSSERIQSYKPLDESVISHLLTSPPRMLHGLRTVIPRDFLTRFRIMENPEKSNDNDKKFEYIIAPLHPKDKKLVEDPITHYSNSISILKNYAKSSQEQITAISKQSINFNLYPNIYDVKKIGWNKDTYKVMDAILSDILKENLSKFEFINDQTSSKLTISKVASSTNVLTVNLNTIDLTIFGIKTHNPEIYTLIKEKIKMNYIPITSSSIDLMRSLIKYTTFISQ